MTTETSANPDSPPQDVDKRTSPTGAFISLHFLESAHCGTGQEGNGVKKQIQREPQTGWPTIWRRSIKGAFRSACCEAEFQKEPKETGNRRRKRSSVNRDSEKITGAFGPSEISNPNDGQAGAVKISPATLLAMPVCSQAGVFAWVTCPEVFRRLKQTFHARGFDNLMKDLPSWSSSTHPKYSAGEIITHANSSLHLSGSARVRLGQMEFEVVNSLSENAFGKIVEWFELYVQQPYMPEQIFEKRLALVSNEAFTYLTRYATEKVQGNALDYDSKTVQPGKLFSIEYLPQETLMYLTVTAADEMSVRGKALSSSDLLDFLRTSLDSTGDIMQFGGEQSKDCGVASLRWNELARVAEQKTNDE